MRPVGSGADRPKSASRDCEASTVSDRLLHRAGVVANETVDRAWATAENPLQLIGVHRGSPGDARPRQLVVVNATSPTKYMDVGREKHPVSASLAGTGTGSCNRISHGCCRTARACRKGSLWEGVVGKIVVGKNSRFIESIPGSKLFSGVRACRYQGFQF